MLKTVFTIGISGLFLWLALRSFELDQFTDAFSRFHAAYVLPALLCYLSSFLFRTIRWKIMLRRVRPVAPRRLFTYIVIGYMANNLLPARLGEVVRAYVTGKEEKMSRSSAFASVLLERLFDGITIVMVLLALMFVSGLNAPWLNNAALVSSLLFLSALAAFLLLAFQKDRALRWAGFVLGFLPRRIGERLLYILDRFLPGLALLREPKDFLVSISMSFVVWACEASVYFIYLKAFDIDAPASAVLLALVMVNLSSLIPSSPGFVGVFQWACVESLRLFSVPGGDALAWSVAVHSTQLLPTTLLGLVFLSRLGLSIREIKRVELSDGR